jgi:hypothetical protein
MMPADSPIQLFSFFSLSCSIEILNHRHKPVASLQTAQEEVARTISIPLIMFVLLLKQNLLGRHATITIEVCVKYIYAFIMHRHLKLREI